MFAPRRGDGNLLTALPVVSFSLVTSLLLVVLGGARALLAIDHPEAVSYLLLTSLALALLVVPMLTLGSAAAKLAARRRDARLSSLRLMGATTRQVGALAVLESVAGALVGAIIGTVGYAALVPLVGLVPFAGEPLGSRLWLPIWWLPLAWLAVGLLAAGSAMVGLRAVSLTPLGVRTRQRPRIARGRRALIALALVGLGVTLGVTLQGAAQLGGLTGVVIAVFVAFGCGLLALDAIGPWYVGWQARRAVRRASDVEQLLAARMNLDDPLAAWRQVSGLAVTTFVGVMAGAGIGLVTLATRSGSLEPSMVEVFGDIRTGVLLTLAIAFVMVAATVAINQAATMLDRAEVRVSLDRLGVPRSMFADASRRAVMMAVLAVVGGSAVAALAVVLPMIGVTVLFAPVSLIVMAATFVAGVLLVRLGATIAGRIVRRV